MFREMLHRPRTLRLFLSLPDLDCCPVSCEGLTMRKTHRSKRHLPDVRLATGERTLSATYKNIKGGRLTDSLCAFAQ